MTTRRMYVATAHVSYLTRPTMGNAGHMTTESVRVDPGTILDPALISDDQLQTLVRKGLVRVYDVPVNNEGNPS